MCKLLITREECNNDSRDLNTVVCALLMRCADSCEKGVLPLGNLNTPRSPRLLARVMLTLLFHLCQDLTEVVARRILHRRERHVGLELLQPQHLADGQDVPVVEIRRTRGGQCTAVA